MIPQDGGCEWTEDLRFYDEVQLLEDESEGKEVFFSQLER